ncbi:pyrimidine/purine nucleoside phosphorylase [Streptococcus loxodontisalivarius]|uniref:Quercetin dioxygenase-like cupin family protein n=1 Tax=Streptococcus loxodontisalivarius TaxID=1349415 RepID=A0ABS2PQA3_9STRE|nr:pyrimidine/purine nucleoside phosphorylase [Streptococcus loxodontisalivarius]MBM7642170.1 quercetin dioxygenase-like cupin family protein [Streptococcus loxodontisalivarius]
MIANLLDLVTYYEGQIASRKLDKTLGLKNALTLYAMAEGETISAETSLSQKLIHVLQGNLDLEVDGQVLNLTEQGMLTIPADASYSLKAVTNTKYYILDL